MKIKEKLNLFDDSKIARLPVTKLAKMASIAFGGIYK
jgi:hypothetical protein